MYRALRSVFLSVIVAVFFVLVADSSSPFSTQVQRFVAIATVLYFTTHFLLFGRNVLERFLERIGL